MNKKATYHVGIDLGTTHLVVGYSAIDADNKTPPKLFEIPQLVAPGEVASKTLLPCFRYHFAPGEISADDTLLPWRSAPVTGDIEDVVIGSWAQLLGSQTLGRSVSSAKSWLSNDHVDRTADILPWSREENDIPKVSPVIATASYLHYVSNAWNHVNPEARLEDQDIVITIPASFDEMARALTVEAANLVGLRDIKLLEEPQAACYDWLYSADTDQLNTLKQQSQMLVIDVGGGTTDLSLLDIDSSDPNLDLPKLNRIRVGDHLMLGGDNIDLAIGYIAESRLGDQQKQLSVSQLSQLSQQARGVKETLLGNSPPESAKITVLGRGSKLLSSSKTVELSLNEVTELAINGFLPLCELSDKPKQSKSALSNVGLPYASDAAISRHIAEFLNSDFDSNRKPDGKESRLPDTIMFNGGPFNSSLLLEQCVTLINQWRTQLGLSNAITLSNPHPDHAVALGAVRYAIARATKQSVISGGSARSYAIAVSSNDSEEKTGNSMTGIGLLSRGIEAESTIHLDRDFNLKVGEPVVFSLYASNKVDIQSGEQLDLANGTWSPLPPLITVVNDQHRKTLPVNIEAILSEIGTLKLTCVEIGNEQNVSLLEFETRRKGSICQNDETLPTNFSRAIELIESTFGTAKKSANPKQVKTLRNDLEKLLGNRNDWSLTTLRALCDRLIEHKARRRRSEQHERIWFFLTGFCLRPGVGHPADEWRRSELEEVIASGLQYSKDTQSWINWWTFLRRVAGGLPEEAQLAIYKTIKPYLDPASKKKRQIVADLKNKAFDDIVRLAAMLERLPSTEKQQLGDWLQERLQDKKESQTLWWALGRIGARQPVYATIDRVISVDTVSQWISGCLKENWNKNSKAALACVLLTQKSSHQDLNISETLRSEVLGKLNNSGCPSLWADIVSSVIELDANDSKALLGESLPPGLSLI